MARSELIRPLPELLRLHAERRGARTAFADATRSVSYGDLERRTGRLAGHLADAGLPAGARVLIMLGNSVAVIESYLAAIRASAIGVPVAPQSSDAELAHILQDSGAVCVITDVGHVDQLRRVAGRRDDLIVVVTGSEPVPALDRFRVLRFDQLATTTPATPARDDLGLDDVAWMLYTSGTTGRPKGVLSSQRNCLWSVAACYVPVLGLSPEDKVLWPLPLFHSLAHILCLHGVLAAGAMARIVDGFAADEILQLLRAEPYTFLVGVPTMYRYLINEARHTGLHTAALRICLVTGALTTPALSKSFEDAFGIRLIDSYGSTETCGAITMNRPTGAQVPGSCGQSVPGLKVRVVDPETGRDVPAGAEGEVWVSGPNVMIGYHGQPEATATALTDGWYHTGDLARRDDLGYLTITGRIKELIIRAGENIHPAEVEEAVRRVTGVADVAVVAKPHEDLGEVPVAFVVAENPGVVDTERIFAACRERLSHFKVPEEVYEISAVPRTASGKIARHRLLEQPARFCAARDAKQESLFRIDWVPVPADLTAAPGRWAVVGDDGWGDAPVHESLDALAVALDGGAQAPGIVLTRGVDDASALVDAWLADDRFADSRLVLVTRGAVSVGGEDITNLADAQVWGVVRAARADHPDRFGLLDLLDEDVPGDVVCALAADEPELAMRNGVLRAPRLASVKASAQSVAVWDKAGTILLIGSATDIAGSVARHLAATHHVRHLLFVETGTHSTELEADLVQLGAEPVFASCDMTDRDAVARLLESARSPLTAVVYAADSAVGAAHLHELTRDLRAFVMFSAADSLLGLAQPRDHARTTASLHALAQHRHVQGLPAVAIARGPQLSEEDILVLLDAAVTTPEPLVLAMRLDLESKRGKENARELPALLRRPPGNPMAQADPASGMRSRLAGMSPVERKRLILQLVHGEAIAVTGGAGLGLHTPDRAFSELGFTSITAVQLRNRLAAATGLALPTTLVFDYPSPVALAEHLVAELTGNPTRVVAGTASAYIDEPIAIVAMSCRYPGEIRSPEDLWRLVESGGDGISGFPADRGWDLERLYDPERRQRGTAYVRTGGFLHDAGEFDAAFFGISPREALAMDPQQRLLLETSWEAFERAGISPASMRGSRTGVFAGVMFHDYASRVRRMPDGVEGYVDTGNAGSVVSGRVAYTFGLEGPAVTVDTACSSSLVALHLACQALRQGECTMALAGGVTVMASPGPFIEFSRQGGLAPDGRCKPFSAAADGTSFAEGVGVLLVERLSDARRNGHPVLAIVRGTAINQDGASNGLTAPNGPSQQRLILEALAKAGLRPDDVDVVEAHGTGTTLGDPIEAQALLATYGQGRDHPLWLGSVKSNLGHTQAAAGVAGVIKMVMAMRHGVLPRTLHVDEPSPHVDWSSGSVRLLATPMAWTTDAPRRAGVSSFGISGTNAHAILEEAAEVSSADEPGQPAGSIPWVLSAKDDVALRAQAASLTNRLAAEPDLNAVDVGFSLAKSRSTFAHRLVVVGHEQLFDGVQAFARNGSSTATVVQGLAQSDREPVFVFPGQGAQWAGMGRELLLSSPVFRRRAEECDEALRPFTGWSVLDVLRDEPGAEPLDRVDVVQPALFTVMVSLAEVWRSFGVVPAAVVGHSQGEIAAAYVSGALSLEDAARVVALRSKAWLSLAGRGGMLSVSLPAEQVMSRLAQWGNRLSVAAVNSPGSVAVSGDPAALDELLAEVLAEGVKARRIPGVDTAGHSAQVDDLRDELLAALAPLRPRLAEIPFYSTVTGGLLDAGTLMDTHYWYRNIREPVEFERAVRSLIADGHSSFVEVSAHPMLAGALQETAEDAGADIAVSGTLRRDDGGTERLLVSLAEAFVHGASVDWPVAFAGTDARIVDLPTYPFQRRRYWLESAEDLADVGAAGLDAADHPLISAITALAGGDSFFGAGRLSRQTHRWLAEHDLVPASAFVEIALRAGDEVGCDHIDELVIEVPLVLPERGGVRLQVVVDGPDEQSKRALSVYARGEEPGQPWTRHATGTLTTGSGGSFPAVEPWPPADATPMDLPHEAIHAWQRDGEIYAEVALPEELEGDASRFGVHPALLEPALQAADGTRLPLRWKGVTLRATGATSLLVRLSPAGADAFSMTCFDPAGQLVLAAESVTFNPAPGGHIQRTTSKSLFRVAWTELPAKTVNVPDAVIFDVPSTVDQDVVTAAHASARRLLAQVQTWLADDHYATSRLAVLTRNAIATGPADPSPDLAVSPAWGLVRSAQSENPGRFVLIDTDGTAASQQRLQAALASGEPQVAIRSGTLFVPRLARVPATDFSPPESGTILVTGGAGTLGGLVARHLAQAHGIRHLVLAGRQGIASAGAEQLAADLTELGAEVVFASCDVADRDELARVIAAIPGDRPLTGVVHAAGTVDDGVCTDLTPDQLERVLLPKVDGAMHLHELTRDMNLSMFVLFSSVAATLGTPGQANYAAANAFLDALAQRRRAEGLPAVSVAWGLWQQRSRLTERLSEADVARLARTGARELATEEALALFDAAQAADEATLVAVHLDTAVLRAQAESLPAMLHGLVRQKARTGKRVGGSALAQQLTGLSEAERHEMLVDLVRRQTAAVLGHADPAAVDPARAFKELGIDSLTALELRNRLAATTEIRLPATLVFDFPSVAAVATKLRDELMGAVSPSEPMAATRRADDDPIAIVAMSCRFPGGVESPDDLWRLLADGGDAISAFPADRGWDVAALYHPDADRPGTTYTREGGFLGNAGEFDAAFFGISPREALAMDPQQRLLLEVCWEALERAGIDAAALRGSSTGVFAGTNMQDYSSLASSVPPEDEGYLLTNTVASVLSGRVAYTFGFEGPAISVDTACSSSLVAIHLAAQSLRQGECALALAGGVTVMATPQSFVAASRQQVLARDGRCKAFADGADGFGMAEGAGVVLLERLSDARRNGHPVLAVVRGSAINQDGASNGLTAPNGPAQERVIRQALRIAGLQPSDVDAVEAHGTGTALGDPIEAQALMAAYGQDRPADHPLRVGSVKSNIGHTLAAAGVAGVIKTVLSLRNDLLPKTLHVDAPTSHVDWSAGTVSLLTEPAQWRQNGHPRRAGVSSFGISGTNAHMILEEPPPPNISEVKAEQDPPVLVPLALSARSTPAVRAQAARLRQWLAESELSPVDIGFSLLSSRSVFEHRAVVMGRDRTELVHRLAELADGVLSPSIVQGVAKPAGKIAFLLSGQGSQRVEMGRELYAAYPVFAKAFDEVCDWLDVELGRSLRDVVFERAEVLNETAFAQAGLFALQVALFRLVESWGVRPDFLIGHSLGEVTAAYLAGVWSLEEACALVAMRGWLMQAAPSRGAMVSVQATEPEVRALLAGRGAAVDIAAVNGPDAVVISGDEDVVTEVAGALAERGRKTKRLRVSHAFHSAHMEPMLEEFRQFLEGLSYAPPAIPIIANLTGRPATPEEVCTADYWVRHVREPVRFMDGIRWLSDEGKATAFLELGPDGVLTAAAHACVADLAVAVPTLRRDQPEEETVLTALSELHVNGAPVAWAEALADRGARRVDLPTYPFQRRHYWLDAPAGPSARSLDSLRYRIAWRAASETSAPALPGVWIVAVPGNAGEDPWTSAAVSTLTEHGAHVVPIELGPSDIDRDRLVERLRTTAGDSQVAGVLSLLALDRQPMPGHPAVPAGLALTVTLLQALTDWGIEAPLWCATNGAASEPVQAQLWGLGRVAALEHPAVWGGLVDLPAVLDAPARRRFAGVLYSRDEDQVAIRSTGVFARRLERCPAQPVSAVRSWRASGTALVTGATGAVGRHVARWLARNGAEHLVLVSRRGEAAPGAAELERELTGLGARVTLAACDAADRVALAQVLDAIPGELPLRTVVHAAGVVDDGVLDSLTTERLSGVLASKAVAARHLHELTTHLDLSAFILFSGMAGTLGAAGQGNYAAANAYLDALAAERRAAGLPATSIAWGWWDVGGMSTGNPEAMERLRRSGVIPMPPDRALAALQQTLGRDETNVCLADTDWELFARTFTATKPSPLISELVATKADSAAESLVRLPADPAERDRVVLDLVRTHTSQVLRGSPDDLDIQRGFLDSGFDSLTAVELRNRLIAATGLTLPSSLIFDYPTPSALARYLGEELARGTGDQSREAELRAALASIPIKRIEEAGLMADLLRLAGAPVPRDEPGSIDEMDVSDLVQLAREARESR